jgi:hypothetical protein
VRPAEVWVGNQWASEGTLIQVAKQEGVPTVQVQHGILEQYYQCAPIYSDRFLVWGTFWREALDSAASGQIDVVNPGFDTAPARADRAPQAMTFFTAPTQSRGLWHPGVARDEPTRVLDGVLGRGREVIVRVHPADQIALWHQAWQRRSGTMGDGISFDKGGDMT